MAAALIGVAGSLATVAVAAPVENAADVVSAWEHHHARFSYFGITSLYTCSGLEDHVKSILLHFGARPGVKVSATGCPYGPDVPSRSAWVDADFESLTAVEAATGETVPALWTKREMSPNRPRFMGEGDCELVEQMKGMIAKNFSLRELSYKTTCVPNELFLNGFAVKAEALIATAPQPAAAD